jgi:hypothetical protein
MSPPLRPPTTGCRGCLDSIVVLALLAIAIVALVVTLGGPTAGLAVLALGLVAFHGRGRPQPRPHPASPLPRMGIGGQARRPPAGPVGGRPRRVPAVPGERDRVKQPSAAATSSGGPARRAGRRGRDPLPVRIRFGVLQRDGFRCKYCGRLGTEPGVVLHVDHVVPIAAGGSSAEDNLVTACQECNLGKGTRAVVDHEDGVAAGSGHWAAVDSD